MSGRVVQVVADHPRHVVLFALVSGLLLAPLPLVVAVVGALLFALGSAAAGGPVSALAAAAVLLGGGVGDLRLAALEHSALGPLLGHVVTEDAEVLEPPRASAFGASGLARVRGEVVLLRLPSNGSPSTRAAGDVLRVTGKLRAPSGFVRARRAHAELRAMSAAPVGRRGGWRGTLDGVRRRAFAGLSQTLPLPEAALLRGMVLGDDSALPDERRDELRAAGLGHLVAASGQNVALLAALAAAAGALLGIPFRARVTAMLGLVALYVPLAGAGPSIQRAGVMGGAVLVAALAGRPASRWYALGLAALITLVLDPRSAQDPGWQLSFAAVLGLAALGPRWRDALHDRGVPAGLADAVALTAAATLATAPIAAAHFGTVSLASLPANVLVAPVVAPITWLGMVAAVAAQLHPVLALPFVVATAPLLAFVLLVGGTFAALPHATVSPLTGLAVTAVVAAALTRRSPVVAAVVVATALLAWQRAPHPPPAPARFRLTFLDVGQGDATLLQDRQASVLVDTGVPEAGVVARLKAAGISRLDLLVVTHAEADHAGGAAAVLRALPVGTLLDGRDGVPNPYDRPIAAALARRRTRVVTPDAGQVLQAGSIRLRVLSPRAEPPERHAGANPNDRAIVLEAEADGQRVLLPADAESEVLASLPLEPVDVLKVSHHGSADPGIGRLLGRLHPRLAGIEVGAHNTYGHPTRSTLAALTRAVPTVVRTDRDGTVRADLQAGGRWTLERAR